MDSSNLKIYYQNVRGLRSKTMQFYRNLSLSSYDILILTETWLMPGVSDSELFDDRYIVWRRDRDYAVTGQSRGGGVLIAVRKDLNATPQPCYCSTAEDLWLTLSIKQRNIRSSIKVSLNICVLYLCKQNLGLSFSNQLNNFLFKLDDILINKPNEKYLIIGDFNMSAISWSLNTGESSLSPDNVNSVDEHSLIDLLYTHNLSQYNGILNNYGRILDLVLSNDTVIVSECQDPLVTIDPHHNALNIDVNFFQLTYLKPEVCTKYIYSKGDYNKINKEISEIDWYNEFKHKSIESAVNCFYSNLNIIINKNIPSKTCKNDTYPVWYTAALKKVLKEKHKFFKKYKTYGNLSDKATFELLRERVKRLESECYLKHIKLVESSIRIDPGYFWKFIKSRSNTSSMPSSLTYGNKVAADGNDICNLFSDYFYSTFLPSSRTLSSSDLDSYDETAVNISNIVIERNELIKLLKSLDINKSAGPDRVPPILLVNCADTISLPISLLFKKSLQECTMPSMWKLAFITPIHKKGSKTDVTNYRPISKLCLIAKLFEKVIHAQLYAALRNSFNDYQHGFVRGRSTVSNLVILEDYITDNMCRGKQIDVVYTDYSKCFDRIDHCTLIHKLSAMGIRGDLLRWFISYISNRSQAVAIKNYISSWVTVPSGVPQGSLLGPLLFVIFVNDIGDCFHSSRLLCFADDMKIFSTISSNNDVQALQADLLRLDDYCVKNMLDLNPSKCSVVTFTRKKNTISSHYTLKGQKISKCDKIRDLGVIFDSKLLFDEHVDSIVKKASRALGFVMRMSSCFKEAKTFKILFCTFVRSILEYGSQIWNPRYDKYIIRLESIQKRFIRYLCYRTRTEYISSDYLKLCAKFHLLPLANRREISDIIFLLKILANNIDSPELLSKICINVPAIVTRHYKPIHLPLASSNYRQNSFMRRAGKSLNASCKTYDIDIFNANHATVRRMLSRDFFKKYLL